MSVEEDPRKTFNWTTENVETCDNGSLCQESLLMIKAGKARKGGWVGWGKGTLWAGLFPLPWGQTIGPPSPFFPSCLRTGAKTAVLGTKGCVADGTQAIMYVQHSPPPGIITVSYSSYCEEPLCNSRQNLLELWKEEETQGAWGGETCALREAR